MRCFLLDAEDPDQIEHDAVLAPQHITAVPPADVSHTQAAESRRLTATKCETVKKSSSRDGMTLPLDVSFESIICHRD